MAENDNMVISSSDLMTILNSDSEELKKYKEVGTVEELKDLKEKEERFDRNIKMFNEIGLEIRNKAIDEFVNLVNECSGYTPNCIEHDLSLTVYTIHQIAEQLKGGAS